MKELATVFVVRAGQSETRPGPNCLFATANACVSTSPKPTHYATRDTHMKYDTWDRKLAYPRGTSSGLDGVLSCADTPPIVIFGAFSRNVRRGSRPTRHNISRRKHVINEGVELHGEAEFRMSVQESHVS